MYLVKESQLSVHQEPVLTDVDPRDPRGTQDALAQLLREGDVALFSRSIDGERVLYASENVHRVLGYTAHEVMGTKDFVPDHIHPDDRAWYHEQTARMSRSGESAIRDFRFRSRNGSYRWIRAHSKVVRDPDGDQVLVGYLADVTEQKELAKGIELQATALRQLADAVIVADPSGRIIDWNHGADQLFGRTAAEVVGRPAGEIFGPDWWTIDPDIVAEADAGRTWRGEIEWRRPDGSDVVVSATMVGLEGACGGRLYVGTGHDVTDLRTAYTEVHAAHLQRAELIGQLLHAEDRERQQIAHDVHDDPIQAMTGLQMRLSLLRRHADDPGLLEEITTLEEIAVDCITRMRNLVFELHPRSLGEDDGLQITLRDLVRNAGEATGARAHLRYELESEPDEVQKILIYRVILEAVTNVRKHAQASELSVTLSSRDDGYLVQIRDDGDGFVADKRAADPGHIGISSMHERVNGAGGSMRIGSQEGAGTLVQFWLPAQLDHSPTR